MEHIAPWLGAQRQAVDACLGYAVFGGGKRIRPIVTLVACRVAGGDPDLALEPGCALELIHTYSLVHDDLPALDNDSLRRGRPTVHCAFDEALAILVGDALFTEAFGVLSRFPHGDDFAGRRAEACALVARATGSLGMVGGQVEDLEATGALPEAGRLERVHQAKTGALLSAAVELGAVVAGASQELRGHYKRFGQGLGLLFQVADDILDVTGTAESLGKTAGKDAAAGKLTYPAVYGLEAACRYRDELAAEVGAMAVDLEGPGGRFAALTSFVAGRRR